MNIVFLTPEFPHPKLNSFGGIGTSIKGLAEACVKLGCKVTIVVYGQDHDHAFDEDGLSFVVLQNVRLKGLSWYLTRKKIQATLNRLQRDRRADIVEAPDWTGITSFIKLKIPIIIREHGSDTYFCYLDQRDVKWASNFHERRALKNSAWNLAVSRFTGVMTNEIFGLNKEFSVIHNGVDPGKFPPSEASDFEPPTILYFGSLIRKKGLLELPHIFNIVNQEHPDARLILIGKDVYDIKTGSPSTWNLMQPLFSDGAIRNVTYLGAVAYTEIPAHITSATLCIFPTFAEALPVSWLEAMAMQKPIVASNIGWGPEIVTDGVDGMLAHPEDHSSFAAKILLLLNDPILRNQISKQARLKIEQHFNSAYIAQQSIALYQSVINKSPR